MTRAVLMEDYLDHARHLDVVKQLGERVDLQIYTDKAATEDALLRRLEGADVAITIRDRVMFTASVLEKARTLKLIVVCGPRLDPHIDLPAATRAGITVCVQPRVDPREPQLIHGATSEINWLLMLGLAKDVLGNDAATRSGRWQSKVGLGLVGKTLGIVGLGRVGVAVARVGIAMGMRLVAWSPSLTPERAASHGCESLSLDALLAQSDFVSLHSNLLPETKGMIGAEQLAMMKPTAYLINTARAGLIDEQALKNALDKGTIAGAGLDVFWQEPLPAGHWLGSHPKVLLQPHMGGFTDTSYEWLFQPAVAAANAWLDGKPIHVANPETLRTAP